MKRETELCDGFAARARESGWLVYPETGGWDLLLVAQTAARTEPGTQVGVQAKLRANVEVIAQAMDAAPLHDFDERPIPNSLGAFVPKGPDFRTVLVPKWSGEFRALCRALRLHVYTHGSEFRHVETVHVPPEGLRRTVNRYALPPIVPSWSGGAPSPKTLSGWRIGALRICATLRARGFVSPADFKAHGIDSSRWVAGGWVTSTGPRGSIVYVPGPRAEALPDVGYEAERDALVAADARAA